jgi:hypothetical protein
MRFSELLDQTQLHRPLATAVTKEPAAAGVLVHPYNSTTRFGLDVTYLLTYLLT